MSGIVQALAGGYASSSSGSSGYFDGTSNTYVYTAGSSDFNFGTGDFTIDFWVRFAAAPSNIGIVGTQVSSGGDGWSVGVFSASIYFQVSSTNAIGATLNSTSTNQWFHMAIVRSGSTMYAFQDGALLTTSTYSGNTSGINQLSVGRFYGSANDSYRLQGYLDELRIGKGIARWTSTFTPPSVEYTADSYDKLLMHFTGTNGSTTFTDSASSPKTLTASGAAVISTAQYKF